MGNTMGLGELQKRWWVCSVALLVVGVLAAVQSAAHGADEKEAKASEPRKVVLVRVPLPIVDQVDAKVAAQIAALVRDGEQQAGGNRPLVVLEFQPAQDVAAKSDFGRSMNLARFLTGPKLAGVQTVAYLPAAVTGHAVLPVLACEQIIVAKDAVLGPADSAGDATLADDYKRLASARLVVPPALAVAFVDGTNSVLRVTTPNGVLFETEAEAAKLRQDGKVIEERSVFPERKPLFLTGTELRELGLASHAADSIAELENALAVPAGALKQVAVPLAGFQPVLVQIRGPIFHRAVQQTMSAIEHNKLHSPMNLLFLKVDSRGGDPQEVLRLANYLSTELGEDCRTVLVVSEQLRGSSLALLTAVDDVVVEAGAKLGAVQEADPSIDRPEDLKEGLMAIAEKNGRGWSLPMALMDGKTQVFAYKQKVTGEVRYASVEEGEVIAANPDLWSKEETPLELAGGIDAVRAVELKVADQIAKGTGELSELYRLAEAPKLLRPNWALQFIERLSDPRVAGLLLFVAIFAIWIEFNTPGVGVPGFVGGVCLLLYFWSQFLHGNAGWLEAILFVAGALFVLLEIAVLPGLGIFGIGGALMMVASVILASQTFIIPHNSYQMRQLPISIGMVIAGGAGGIAALYVIQRYLPHTPFLNRLMLTLPSDEELSELEQRETVGNWSHLLGVEGKATTMLVPAGKAKFGKEVVDVLTEGELVERGRTVVVTLVSGNRVVVREV